MRHDDYYNQLVPIVIESTRHGERAYDIFSRLLKDRIIIIGAPITDAFAASIIAQLLFLESEDPKKDIYLYIDSPGGSIPAGLAIYDTIQYIRPDVSTICMGLAASMAALLLAAGTPGKRYALPHARILIHQPMSGVSGQVTDIVIHAKEIMRLREELNRIFAKHTGQPVEKIAQDTERDYWMTAEEARAYGIVDKVIERREK